MSAIAAAVTPVVMISANAILVSAISSKHQAMSDRVRALTAEWRRSDTLPERRHAIRDQVLVFEKRLTWITRSHILLYVATGFFIVMVISIALTTARQTWSLISLPLLISGVGLTFVAIVLELLDLWKARDTIAIESRDVMQGN